MIFHGYIDERHTVIDTSYVPGLGSNIYFLHVIQRTHWVISDASGTHIRGIGLAFSRDSKGDKTIDSVGML